MYVNTDTGSRMKEFECGRMQRLPRKRVKQVVWPTTRPVAARAHASIRQIADDRMADRGQVYAELVCPPRRRKKPKAGHCPVTLGHDVSSRCRPASPRMDTHPLPLVSMSTDRSIDEPFAR